MLIAGEEISGLRRGRAQAAEEAWPEEETNDPVACRSIQSSSHQSQRTRTRPYERLERTTGGATRNNPMFLPLTEALENRNTPTGEELHRSVEQDDHEQRNSRQHAVRSAALPRPIAEHDESRGCHSVAQSTRDTPE